MLELKKVSKTFAQASGVSVEAVRNISVAVHEREFVAFVGPSGCGKTTLLKLIAGLELPTEGDIVFNGKRITTTGRDRGMVFQDFTLFPWLTVKENISFGLQLKKMPADKIFDIVSYYLKITGLEQFADTYPSALSGGMQQRAALARTLANNPEALLLDEPFGALDVQTRSYMQEFLASLWEKERKIAILVTHDVEEAIYLADRIVVLSTKPGSVKEIIDVPLRRPRRPEIRFQEDFLRLKKHITYLIRSETLKAALQEQTTLVDGHSLKIGLNIWSGNALFYFAKDRGLFMEKDLDVELMSLEKNEDRIKSFIDDTVDAFNVTLDTAVRLKQSIPDLKILMFLNRSYGGDALLARESIKSFSDLKGKKIGIEKGWVSHFFLLYILDKVGLSAREVQLVDIKGSDVGSALIAHHIDAGIVWEPWLSKSKEFSGANVLATTREFPVIYDVLVVKEAVYRRRAADFKKLQSVWSQAARSFKTNPSEAMKIVAPYFYISESELTESINQLHFLEETPEDAGPLIKDIQSVLCKGGLLREFFEPSELMLL